jgi:hypothetical protein
VVQADHKVCHMYDTKNDVHPHSTEQDTQPIVVPEQDTQPITVLISKQVVPYRTHSDTCCTGVSTPKIRSLADSTTTFHDSINHLHHFNHCSKYSIDPHTANSHLDGWKTTTLLQRYKSNSTSQRMEDLYNSQDCMAKHN